MNKRYILYFILIILAITAVLAINKKQNGTAAEPVLAGTPAAEASPSSTPVSLADQVKIESPVANQTVASPLVVKGQARGGWYFEASFPVRLLDGNGKEIARGQAQAQGEWMTANFVPFVATLPFAPPTTVNGTLILAKDNPSGRPQNDAEIMIPVKFGRFETPKPTTADLSACQPSGCSGEICSDQNVISTCVYKSEYACYKRAVCERQASGQCGWTMTPDLKQCLAQGGLQQP